MQFLLLLHNIPKLQLKQQLLTIHSTKMKEKVFTLVFVSELLIFQ